MCPQEPDDYVETRLELNTIFIIDKPVINYRYRNTTGLKICTWYLQIGQGSQQHNSNCCLDTGYNSYTL